MAKEVLRDPVITVNSVDLSDHFRQVAMPIEWSSVDFTVFGNIWTEEGKGMLTGTLDLEGFQDFAPGEVDATLWPLFIGDVTFPVTLKAHVGAVTVSNPLWTMTARLMNYSPLDGAVGDASKVSVKFSNAGQSGIVKTTS